MINICSVYKKMNEDSRIISSGPLKGKKIEFAPTTGIDRFFALIVQMGYQRGPDRKQRGGCGC